MSKELRRRVLSPLVVPILALLAIGIIVFNLSRVLLLLHGTSATVVAMVGASAVLFGATYLSARRRPLSGLGVVAGVGGLVVLSGMAAVAALDAREAEEHAEGDQPLGEPAAVVTALDTLRFDPVEARVPAGGAVLGYVNGGTQTHTLVIEGKPGFKLEVQAEGDADRDEVDLAPGRYVMFCDVPGHRQGGMEGTVEAVEGLASPGGAGGGAPLAVKANDQLKFDPATLTAPPGKVAISLVNEGTLGHTMVIEGKPGFKLTVDTKGARDEGEADLPAGSYTLYCDVPGHRQGGMQAALTVAAGPGPPGEAAGA